MAARAEAPAEDEGDLETAPLLPQKASPGEVIAVESSDLLLPSTTGHYPFLDITRIACVWCVAVDHGNSAFGVWNCLFAQDWVLQYLYLVCGVCYGMSSRGLAGYEARLGAYVFIGVLVNWAAYLLTGQDWRSNFFNVVFHLWFVVGLMIYAVLLAPLKRYLASVRSWPRGARVHGAATSVDRATPEAEHPVEEGGAWLPAGNSEQAYRDSLLRTLAVIGGGLVLILLLFKVCLSPLTELLAPVTWHFWQGFGEGAEFWGLPSNLEQSQDFLRHIFTYCMSTCSNIYLIIVCPLVFGRISITTWAVLINTYGHRLLFYRAKDERPFHGLDLMIIALTCYFFGLRHRRKIGEYLIRYWFVLLFACGLLWPPGTHGRFDENPPLDMHARIRMNLLEFLFVLVWLVAGERLVQPEIFTQDKLEFLNDWALLVFLVHKAVHIALLPPFNWLALLALAPACRLCRRGECPGA